MSHRTLVIGDIHGAYKALLQVLDRAGVAANDKLVFLGDYVDGWSQSPEVIDHLMGLNKINECVFIRGNHDDLFHKWLQEGEHNEQWLFHGGQATLDAYDKMDQELIDVHEGFLASLNNYHLDEENRLFVHAGFTNLHGVDYEYFPKMLYWDRTLWEMALALNPMLAEDDSLYPKRLQHYSEIYIGHTPTTRIEVTKPVNKANVWNMDTGAAYKSPLTIMDVDTKEFWQSDNVNELYPHEKGRN